MGHRDGYAPDGVHADLATVKDGGGKRAATSRKSLSDAPLARSCVPSSADNNRRGPSDHHKASHTDLCCTPRLTKTNRGALASLHL